MAIFSIILIGFFSVIGIAVWRTKSAMPLWALVLIPLIFDTIGV